MISSPSPVGIGSYGYRLRWALPIRWGTTPPATYAEVWFTSADNADESRFVSIRCPMPVRARWCSAATIPSAECRPVITSNTEMPDRNGGPSGDPVKLISPDTPCTNKS
jgi:hypothetical protein